MEVAELIKEKEELEQRIELFVQEELEKFQERTGFLVHDVSVGRAPATDGFDDLDYKHWWTYVHVYVSVGREGTNTYELRTINTALL